MKKIIGAILVFVALVGAIFLTLAKNDKSDRLAESSQSSVKSETKYYSYLDNIDLSKTVRSANEMSLAYNPQIPKSIESLSTNIFIARVISLDKADSPAINKKEIKGDIFPFTYGKLKVLTNISGEMPRSATEFVRGGGVMKEKDIYKYDYPTAIAKMDAGRVAAGLPKVEDSETLIDTRYEGDVYLEAGKVYLMYAEWNENWQKYEIIGFQYGSLELMDSEQPIDKMPESNGNGKGNGKGKALGKTWKVKNVGNGQEKKLNEYLQEDLNINISEQ